MRDKQGEKSHIQKVFFKVLVASQEPYNKTNHNKGFVKFESKNSTIYFSWRSLLK